MSEKKSGGIGVLFLGILTAGIAYFTSGVETPYDYLLLGMIGIVSLLSLVSKIGKKTAYFALFSFLLFGTGSLLLFNMQLGDYALIARVLTIIIFIFACITAFAFVLKVIFSVIGMGLIVLCIIYLQNREVEFQEDSGVVEMTTDGIEEGESVKTEEKPSDRLQSHQITWLDFSNRRYKNKMEVWQSAYQGSAKFREDELIEPSVSTSIEYWRGIYRQLIQKDKEHIDKILEMLLTEGKSRNLNQMEFAQMVVTFVQSIPYVLIYQKNCNNIRTENPELLELSETYGCKGQVRYGLQSPVEFAYTLQGDCDTRTVFLFTILSKLGYQVCILNSDQYSHSVLGVALPAKGDYKRYRGHNYYLWETTTKGWNIGVVPPEMNNMNFWDVIVHN